MCTFVCHFYSFNYAEAKVVVYVLLFTLHSVLSDCWFVKLCTHNLSPFLICPAISWEIMHFVAFAPKPALIQYENARHKKTSRLPLQPLVWRESR